MIIDFSVKNFRSFKDEQFLSFVARNADKLLPENTIEVDIPGLKGIKLLKGLAVFGANAAGKSNILQALRFLSRFVAVSATELNEGDPTGTEPFLLDKDSPEEPSEFKIRFIVEKIRYHFVLVVNNKRVLFESLSAFPKGSEQVWYERSWNDNTSSYSWAPKKSGYYKRDSKIEKYTRENALFLSTAVKLNDEQLRPVYLWFKEKVRAIRGAGAPFLSHSFTAKQITKDANKRAVITKLLQHADLGILSARANERNYQREELPSDMPADLIDKIVESTHHEVELGHQGTEGKEFSLDWEDESIGTQTYFALIGPWLDILENGYFACLDEIETSMHPNMVSELLRLVFSKKYNNKGSQILFATHNPLLLDPTLIRRDQVWFVEKDSEGATHLYPLSDYKPRKGESLVRGYLSGRYGAVPFLPKGLIDQEEVTHG